MEKEKSSSLIQISSEIDVMLNISQGELTPEIEERLKALATKADSCAYVLDRLALVKQFYTERAGLYAKMAASADKAHERLEDYIKDSIVAANTDEIKGAEFRFKLSSTTKCVVDSEDDVPENFKSTVVKTTPDKARIKKAIETGQTVSGAHLETGMSLRRYTVKP